MYRVLLAEDEAIMRTAFRKMMNWEDSEYVLAAAVSNGAEALEYLKSNSVDIVVTDLKMPVMDGLELLTALKQENFCGVTLVLSNYTDFDLVRSALTNGAFDYMLKLNLDADLLHRQLDTAAKMLQESEHTEAQWTGEAPIAASLRAYFPTSSAAPSALVNLFAQHDAFIPCFIRVQQTDENKPMKSSPAERALFILEQAFAQLEATIAPMNAQEILLLIPDNRQPERIENKLQQTVREIQMYLNLTTHVLLMPKSPTPDAARRYYTECVRLCADSQSASSVCYLRDVIFAGMPQFAGYETYKKEVQDALLYVYFHFCEKLQLEDVAKAVSLNSSYLCRLFKQETGTSLFRHVNNLRMQKAAELIESGNTYMKEVSAAIGIEDQFLFARVFKKHYGMPPSEYAKMKKDAST